MVRIDEPLWQIKERQKARIKGIKGYEIKIHEIKEPIVGQQKLMSIIRYDNNFREEIDTQMIPLEHSEVIRDICDILHQYRKQFSKLNLILRE